MSKKFRSKKRKDGSRYAYPIKGKKEYVEPSMKVHKIGLPKRHPCEYCGKLTYNPHFCSERCYKLARKGIPIGEEPKIEPKELKRHRRHYFEFTYEDLEVLGALADSLKKTGLKKREMVIYDYEGKGAYTLQVFVGRKGEKHWDVDLQKALKKFKIALKKKKIKTFKGKAPEYRFDEGMYTEKYKGVGHCLNCGKAILKPKIFCDQSCSSRYRKTHVTKIYGGKPFTGKESLREVK